MKILQNGILITPMGSIKGDLAMEDGRIVKMAEHIPVGVEDEVFDAEGCIVFPGFIDQHTHLQMDNGVTWTADDFESGTRAAACGGTTCIVDFATQDRGGTLMAALDTWKSRSAGKSRCNTAFRMAITDWSESVYRELPLIRKAGVSSFKIYMAYDALRVDDAQALQILRAMKEIGGLCGCHCENGTLVNFLQKKEIEAGHTDPSAHPVSRPAEAEAEAIDRYLWLARLADVPVYIVHLSTALGLEEIRRAKKRGQTVYIETCPQYLLMDDSRYRLPGFESAKYVMSPPLRKAADVQALREAVLSGEVDAVATDHCSFRFADQKQLGKDDFRKIPNGAPGIEHRPALILDLFRDSLSYEKLCRLLSEGPARLMNLYPKKGCLAVGSDADVTVWDPDQVWTIRADDQQQNVDYTPYEGKNVRGRARMVFVNGTLAAGDGKPVGEPCGTYVSR